MTFDQLTIHVSQNTASGCLYALVFRDLNGNGLYEEGVDALYDKNRFVSDSTEFTVSVGDADGDTISDSREMQEGTDPLDPKSYCYQAVARITGVFATTNQLTCSAVFGTNEILTATIVTNSEFVADFGHHSTTNGEIVTLWFWDDANSNSVRDVNETCTSIGIKPNGHEVTYEGTLSTSAFDKDRNGLMDWWEVQTGLSELDASHKETDDNDHDGLINLHEYWAGTDPLTPDGSNTLLSVCARSIDDRIRDVVPPNATPRFVNYITAGPNGAFMQNTNFWARDIDTSCVSVWQPLSDPGSRCATAITRRHVIVANHWYAASYVFCDTNGVVITRSLSRSVQLDDDLRLGQLNEPLPPTVKLPKVLPVAYADYLATGKYLPTLCMNQEKCATVLELAKTDCEVTDSSSRRHFHYGQLLSDNFCSEQRHAIRAATLGGNSGSPVFLVAGADLVFLFAKHLGSSTELTWCPFYGPTVMPRETLIQNMINQWEGEDADLYQMDIMDLSVFEKLQRGESE